MTIARLNGVRPAADNAADAVARLNEIAQDLADQHKEPYLVVAGDKGSPTYTGKLSYVLREADALGWELDRVTFRATPTKGT